MTDKSASRKDIAPLRDALCADLQRHELRHRGVLWAFLYLWITPGFLALFLYRLSAACRRQPGILRHIGTLIWRLNVFLNSCDLAPEAIIGPGCYIPHPMGIVIGSAIIGANASILQNVTIGMHYDAPFASEFYPKLGDNVRVAAGAVILGPITIGDSATIGANSVVLKDVPARCSAVGVPARILPHKEN